MRQLQPHSLWLGHAGDAHEFRKILDAGIIAVVQLAAEEPPVLLPRELLCFRFPLIDGTGNDPKVLDLAVTTVANLVEKNLPTLLCCGGGMSRPGSDCGRAIFGLSGTSRPLPEKGNRPLSR